jgi:hypothetical protein
MILELLVNDAVVRFFPYDEPQKFKTPIKCGLNKEGVYS